MRRKRKIRRKWVLGEIDKRVYQEEEACCMGRDLFSPAEEGRTRSNGAKLREPRFHLDARKHFLTVRAPRVWNGLPWEVVEAPVLRVFKDRLDMHMVGML